MDNSQLRTDKLQFISEETWEKVKDPIECGMDWKTINARGGMNVNKLLAYYALACSASIPWPEFDIDKCVVVNDFEAHVTDMMLYIKSDYTTERGVQTVKINHIDGSGMYLPGAKSIPDDLQGKNFMFRGPYHKGLLSPFQYLKFCEEHNVEPIIEDAWGKTHNLREEGIEIVFSSSQFKLQKLYSSHEEFKYYYKKYNAHFCIAQFEEDDLPDKNFNYQMIGFDPLHSNV